MILDSTLSCCIAGQHNCRSYLCLLHLLLNIVLSVHVKQLAWRNVNITHFVTSYSQYSTIHSSIIVLLVLTFIHYLELIMLDTAASVLGEFCPWHFTVPPHNERRACDASIFFLSVCCLTAAQSDQHLLIWWWAVKWPVCPHGWLAEAERDSVDFLTMQSLWLCTILYTHLTLSHTHTLVPPPWTLRANKVVAPRCPLALSQSASLPLGKLRCQE